MSSISAGQVKMARALLDWSQEDLAERSGLSISTIRNIELGYAPRRSTFKEIRDTIEEAGIEFTDGEGVRRRFNLEIYQGLDSCNKLLDDMLQTVEQKGGDILGFVKSQKMLMQSCGILHPKNIYRLENLHKAATVKCILIESTEAAFALPPFQYRLIAEPDASPSYFYVYGNKHVMIVPRSDGSFQFVVLALMSQAQACQRHFQALWNQASLLPAHNGKK